MSKAITKGFIQHHFLGAKSGAGFTIIELLVVIAIIGLISSVVLVSMKGSTGKAKIAKSLEFSQTILNVAGIDAVGIWSFDEGEGDYAFDKSGYGNRGTLVGKPDWVSGDENTPHWFVNEGQGRSALEFDGSDYVNCGNNSSLNTTNAVTIEAWIKPNNLHHGAVYAPIWNNAANRHLTFMVLNNGRLNLTLGNGSIHTNFQSTESYQAGKWSHIVATWEDTTDSVNIYLNSKNVKQDTFAGPLDLTGFNALIGKISWGWSFNGIIDEVRIYERALGSSEIQQHYAAGAKKHQLAISN